MSQNIHFEKIQAFIQSGNTKAVFDYTRNQSLAPSIQKTLTVIEAEYHEVKQAELKGTQSFQELQIRKNKINDQLLALFQSDQSKAPTKSSPFSLPKTSLLIGVLLAGLFFGWMSLKTDTYPCPSFSAESTNKILILPFEKVSGDVAEPQLVLRQKIDKLTSKHNLSSSVKVGEAVKNITQADAPEFAKQCDANVLLWGTYSAQADSIHLIMQYVFTDLPQFNNEGEVISLKDITALHSGSMAKDLEDAIMSLCGVIAIRQGKKELAKKWMDKVVEKEAVDRQILEIVN